MITDRALTLLTWLLFAAVFIPLFQYIYSVICGNIEILRAL